VDERSLSNEKRSDGVLRGRWQHELARCRCIKKARGGGDALPTSRWLEDYAERFRGVEVNTTFYQLPAPALERVEPGRAPAHQDRPRRRRRLRHRGEQQLVVSVSA
jgi:hypothetical protein